MELTKEHFDQAIKNLASVTKTVDTVAVHTASLVTDMMDVKKQIKEIRLTLDSHTNALDQLVKQTKDWNTEMVMVRARLDRHDQWFKQIAEKVDVKLKA